MKTLIIISWIIVGIGILGSLISLSEGIDIGYTIIGLAIYVFYGVFTYNANKLIK